MRGLALAGELRLFSWAPISGLLSVGLALPLKSTPTGVEFGEFKEQGRWAGRWAAKIAHRGKTLEFVVKNNARTDFKAKENYT